MRIAFAIWITVCVFIAPFMHLVMDGADGWDEAPFRLKAAFTLICAAIIPALAIGFIAALAALWSWAIR